jgi:GTP cyclohydrolase I
MNNLDFDDDLTDEHLSDSGVDIESTQEALSALLRALGEKPEREGLRNTPKRVARMYTELLNGYHTDPRKIVNGALFNINYDEMVIVRDIEFYSLCEHHLLPFLGRAHIAYMPAGKVIGLSKIPRIVDIFAHRLQVQERLTRQIADLLQELLEPNGVAVVMEGMHLCTMMRGVKKHDARLITSAMQGSFRTNPSTRQEFLDNIGRGAGPLKI